MTNNFDIQEQKDSHMHLQQRALTYHTLYFLTKQTTAYCIWDKQSERHPVGVPLPLVLFTGRQVQFSLRAQAKTSVLQCKHDISRVDIEMDITSDAGLVWFFLIFMLCSHISHLQAIFSPQIVCQSTVRKSCPNCLPLR